MQKAPSVCSELTRTWASCPNARITRLLSTPTGLVAIFSIMVSQGASCLAIEVLLALLSGPRVFRHEPSRRLKSVDICSVAYQRFNSNRFANAQINDQTVGPPVRFLVCG